MEIRKKGSFSDNSGSLRKELDQMEIMEKELGFAEENATLTRACGAYFTIVCC